MARLLTSMLDMGLRSRKTFKLGLTVRYIPILLLMIKKGKVIIKRNAKIGSHSVIMPGVTIGMNAVVGAFSFVTEDILDNVVACGIPAKVIEYQQGRNNQK